MSGQDKDRQLSLLTFKQLFPDGDEAGSRDNMVQEQTESIPVKELLSATYKLGHVGMLGNLWGPQNVHSLPQQGININITQRGINKY